MKSKLINFPTTDGTRVPMEVYRSQEVYERELERIYRGPTWKVFVPPAFGRWRKGSRPQRQ